MTPSDSKPATTPSVIEPVLTEGQKLAGCYLLQKQVDTGGSGTVWLAHDEVLGRDISLHFLPPQLRSDVAALDEIRKEVKKNRQLIHPNILRVHDLVEEPEFVAISMDSFAGRSLASLLKEKGSLEPSAIQAWIGQLCQTLEDAHKVNLTHRDLAPSNIFVSDGKLVLASFGISRCIQDALGRVLRGSNPRLSYLSPQLADGLPPARTDDVYSLGMLLFELLTGELPFNGGDVLSQIKRVAAPRVSARLAASRRSADLPATWDETIAAALRKDASQRPASALEVAGKLETVAAKSAKPEETAAKPTEPTPSPTQVPEKVAGATVGVTEKLVELKKTEVPASAQGSSEPAQRSGAVSSEPQPRKAVEILRERAAELARTKSSGTTPAPIPAAEKKAPTPPPVPAESNAAPTILPPPKKDSATEIYPSLYPQRSRGPALALAAGVAFAAIAGIGYFLQDSRDSDGSAGEDVDIATTEDAYASEIRSVNHKTELPEPAAAPEPPSRTIESTPTATMTAKVDAPVAKPVAVAPVEAPKPPVASPSPMPVAVEVAKPAPAATPAIPAPIATVAPAPKSAEVTAPPVAAIAPAPKSDDSAEILLAANQAGSRKSSQSAKPAPAPVAAPIDPANATPEAVAEKVAAVEKLKSELQAAESAYDGLVKQQQQMESSTAEVQKLLEQKSKELAPLRKSTEDLQKTRKQREDAQKTAELEAQKAQQLAAEKARLAEEAKRALADLDLLNQEKVTAQQKADAEVATLRTTLTEKQQAAAAATKAANEAKLARQQQQAAIDKAQQDADQTKLIVAKAMAAETARKAREEAAELMAEKAKERQRIETEIAAMKKMFDEKMKVLEDAQKAISDAEAKSKDTDGMQKKAEEEALKMLNKPAAAAGSNVPTPEKATTTVPAPTAGALVPSDNPLAQAAAAAAMQPKATPPVTAPAPAAEPAATLAMKTEPAKVVTPQPNPAPTKPTQGGSLPENSLGMKFAPVGDVQFSIWQTRVKDFEVFAKAVDLRSNAWKGPGFKQGPDHPVVNVTWHEAVAFCKWLTEKERKEGTLTAGQLYRLPSDLEWSKAVGLTDETGRTPEARDMGIPDVYPWGNQWPPPASAGNYTGEETGSDVAIKGYDDSFAWTSPVGSFPPNQLGLYDMGGNVWQWVMDAWNGESKHKVLRGASWYNGALKLSLLSSCRVHAAPDSSTDNYGFRLVRAPESGKAGR